MVKRHPNRGLRKVCSCARRAWSKCKHPWHFNFKARGGATYRFSVDVEAGKHIAGKTEAEALAEGWRQQIRAGTFRRREELVSVPAPPVAQDVLTLRAFSERYAERLGRPLSANDQGCLKQLLEHDGLGETALVAITEDAVEAFFAKLRTAGKAASTRNKFVQATTRMFRWAVRKGYLTRSPIEGSDTIRREKHAQRHRRLAPGEEAALLASSPAHLQRLIIAAIETGCRRGELLSLTWANVSIERREITIRAEHSKTRTYRVLPVSGRLRGILEMAKLDPAGEEFGPAAYVFGDAVGERVGSFKRAWETAVVKATGHTPAWTSQNALTATSKAVYDAADLHFHDLRHEAGSRFLEAGWPLHEVAHMLGHANVKQTSTYLNVTTIGLHERMRRLDEARGCNPVADGPVVAPSPDRNEKVPARTEVVVN